MGALETHGITHALSEGQVEPEGEYKATSILLTGGTGFIASHVAIHLVQRYPDTKVVVLDKLDYSASVANLDAVKNCPSFETHADSSFGNSLAFTMNNTYGTHVLLEACCEYGGLRRREMMVKAYMTSYKLPCIITRGNNVYDSHQFPKELVPKFTLLARRGGSLPVHGAGESTRSYLYVEDVAEAFEVILRKGFIGETYNIGTQKEHTVMDVAHAIVNHFNLPVNNIIHVRDRAFNDQRYYICDKKIAALGWTEKISWDAGLEKTIDWYQEHRLESRWIGNVERALAAHPQAQ